MRRLIPVVSLVAATIFSLGPALSHADDLHKRLSSSKRKRAVKAHPKVLEPAAPGVVPPGAQLTPDRVIEAPQAPGPSSSPGRVVVPAREVTPKRDADRGAVQPPYPTGPDPGRNMQPATGLSPSSQPIVP